jgi:hypothetical protein
VKIPIELWTIQPPEVLSIIEKNGIYFANSDFVSEEYKYAYNWMMNKMNERIDYKPENKNIVPIWAWYQFENNKKRKPDLRRSNHLVTGREGYRMLLHKQPNEVLLSDFLLWHFPLNDFGYIPNDKKDEQEFEKELIKNNLEKLPKDQLPKKFNQIIEKSWEKIFDLEYCYEEYADSKKDKRIQATFWYIRKEEIKDIKKFIAR